MNTLLKPFKSFFFLLVMISFTLSCSEKMSNSAPKNIAKLVDRGDKIQLGTEWDFIQNYYAKQLESLSADPQDVEAKLNLAELFVKEARVTGEHGHYYPAALQMTEEILSTTKNNKDVSFRAFVTRAGVQLSLHEFDAALQTAKKALKLNENNAQIYGVLVDCYVELGDYSKAVDMADKMISIKPDLRSYSRVSYLREIHGDDTGAIEAMLMAVKAGYPGYEETAWAMQTLGELYMLHGDVTKAEKVFLSILQDRPDYPFAVAALGEIAYLEGDLEKAELITRRSMEIIPEVGFYVQLAKVLKDQGRISEMSTIMDEVFVMLADDVLNGHNMNLEYADIFLHLMEDPDQSLKYASLEYYKRPNNIDVNRTMAEIYSYKNDTRSAHRHIAVASITDSNHPQLVLLKESTNYTGI